jgi:hypothetical protein
MHRLIEAALRGVANLDAAETPELNEAARRWVLLLQADSDDDTGMMWGDGGRLFVWIPETRSPTSTSPRCAGSCSATNALGGGARCR